MQLTHVARVQLDASVSAVDASLKETLAAYVEQVAKCACYVSPYLAQLTSVIVRIKETVNALCQEALNEAATSEHEVEECLGKMRMFAERLNRSHAAALEAMMNPRPLTA
jgi:hypothetical protein